MAKSRLKQIILDHLDPQQAYRQRPVFPEIHLSADSTVYTKTYIQNGALTLFYRQPEQFDMSFLSQAAFYQAAEQCLPDMNYGHRHEPKHDKWHQSITDFEEDHSHVLKNYRHDKWTYEDLACLFNVIAETESLNEEMLKDRHIISPHDAEAIMYQFRLHQEKEEKYQKLRRDLKDTYENFNHYLLLKVSEYFQAGAKSFLQSFLNTLIHQYLKPAYINFYVENENADGNTRTQAEALATFAESVVNGICYPSFFEAALHNITTSALRTILVKFGFKNAQEMTQAISSALLILQNPFSLAQMGVQATAGAAGFQAASALIQRLPKLKIEAETNDTVMAMANTTNQARLFTRHTPSSAKENSHPTLRRRF